MKISTYISRFLIICKLKFKRGVCNTGLFLIFAIFFFENYFRKIKAEWPCIQANRASSFGVHCGQTYIHTYIHNHTKTLIIVEINKPLQIYLVSCPLHFKHTIIYLLLKRSRSRPKLFIELKTYI